MHGILCELCKKRPATTHLTEVGERPGTAGELHVCNACIRALALDLHGQPLPVAGILELHAKQEPETPGKILSSGIAINLKPGAAGGALRRQARDCSCPGCGLSLSRFLTTNRFGCSACYQAFAAHLDQVFAEIQYGRRHVGRVPAAHPETQQRRLAQRLHLRDRLDQAIAAEDYESAAGLRDQLRILEEQDEGDLS